MFPLEFVEEIVLVSTVMLPTLTLPANVELPLLSISKRLVLFVSSFNSCAVVVPKDIAVLVSS